MEIPVQVYYIVAITLAYLLGSIPVGLVVVKALTGQDVREIGSGRTGGTNALRAGGLPAGILTGLGDVAKGIGAVNIARLLIPGQPNLYIIEALCAFAAVLGHNYSIYIGFKGGAGTGPNVGAAAAMWPFSFLLVAPAGVLTLLFSGYASVASTVVAVIIAIIFGIRYALELSPMAYLVYAVGTTALVAIALIPNYRRLIAGTERIVGPRARRLQQSSPGQE